MPTLHGALIELFELDLSVQGGGYFRWHNGSNEFGTDVIWNGLAYSRLPVEASGFDISGAGKLPRPTLRVGNVNQMVGNLARQFNDILGCKVIRRRTFAKYLDAANFVNGNPTADPYAEFPIDVFYVNRKSQEDKEMIVWELVSALDLQGVSIPKRQIIANNCPWVFPPSSKHPECPYTGGLTTCDHTLYGSNGCKVHFPGTDVSYPFGGFPGATIGRA
jgi:lambda family phage minor tail protein L